MAGFETLTPQWGSHQKEYSNIVTCISIDINNQRMNRAMDPDEIKFWIKMPDFVVVSSDDCEDDKWSWFTTLERLGVKSEKKMVLGVPPVNRHKSSFHGSTHTRSGSADAVFIEKLWVACPMPRIVVCTFASSWSSILVPGLDHVFETALSLRRSSCLVWWSSLTWSDQYGRV